MRQPKISVIVPVYNVEPYLRKSINSLVEQTYSNLEIILVDDGSTDGSEAICDGYADRYPHIKVIHQKNAGQSAARNAGIEMAAGEWIAFLDSDDWIEKEMYETLLSLAQAYEADLASCATREWTVNGESLSCSHTGKVYVLTPDEMIAGLVTHEIVRYEVWNKLWKRSLIGDIRFIAGQIGEEVHFDRLLFLKANKMVHMDLPMHNYLVRRPGSTASAFRPARLCVFDEFDELIQELEKNNKFELADAVRRIASTFAYNICCEAVDTGQDPEIMTQLEKKFRYFYRGKKTNSSFFKKMGLKMKLFNFNPKLTLLLRKFKKTAPNPIANDREMKSNMLNSKKFAAVIGYLTIALNLLYNLLFTPFILRALGQSEYGVYTLCSSVISNLSLLQFGFGATFIRYYIRYSAEGNSRRAEELNGMFAEIFGLIAVVTAVIGAFLVANIQTIFGSKITPHEYEITCTLLRIMVFSAVISILGVPFQSLVTAHEEFVFQKLLAFAEGILKTAVLPPLLLLGYKSVAIVAVSAALAVITLTANMIFVFRTLRARFRFSNFDFRLFREMGVFSFFVFLQSVADMLNWQIDRFLLARFWGSAEVAVYSVGAQINSIYLLLTAALTVLFVPKANQIAAEGGENEALSALMIKLGRLQFLVCTFLLSAFIFFGQAFVKFFAGAGYENAYFVTILLMTPLLLPMSMDLWCHIARAKALHKTSTTVFALAAFSNLIISIPLSRRYGEIGAAVGTCIGMFIANNIFQIWYAQKVIGLDMKLWAKNLLSMTPAFIFPVIAGIGIMLFVNLKTISIFLVFACLYAAVCAVSFWVIALNQEERNMFIRPAVYISKKLLRK